MKMSNTDEHSPSENDPLTVRLKIAQEMIRKGVRPNTGFARRVFELLPESAPPCAKAGLIRDWHFSLTEVYDEYLTPLHQPAQWKKFLGLAAIKPDIQPRICASPRFRINYYYREYDKKLPQAQQDDPGGMGTILGMEPGFNLGPPKDMVFHFIPENEIPLGKAEAEILQTCNQCHEDISGVILPKLSDLRRRAEPKNFLGRMRYGWSREKNEQRYHRLGYILRSIDDFRAKLHAKICLDAMGIRRTIPNESAIEEKFEGFVVEMNTKQRSRRSVYAI